MNGDSSPGIVTAMQEAIRALRYVRPEFDHTLAIFCEQYPGRNPKEIGRKVRSFGAQLSHAEKRSLGIRSFVRFGRLSQEMLTDRGLGDPVHSIDATVGRALLTEARSAAIAAAQETSAAPTQLCISAPFRDCPGCSRLAGCAFPPGEPLALPPLDCDREVCTLLVEPRVDSLAAVA